MSRELLRILHRSRQDEGKGGGHDSGITDLSITVGAMCLPIKPRQAQHREDRLLPLYAQKQGSPTPYSPSHCWFHVHTPRLPMHQSRCRIDSELSMGPHVKRVTKSAFYHPRLISRIRRFLNLSDTKTLVFAFVLSRIDFCNC